ncbi:MAG: hypothetical protein P9M13_00865 [Candidatus Ancaeobacter aquaticus]|nr:hypothetical protein [Candidatus Ancaeobacter aquaticus]
MKFNKARRALTIFFIFVFVILTNGFAYAWEDCPFGLQYDPYPGRCERYVDTNGDNYCDHSQTSPVEREEANDDNISKIKEQDQPVLIE